MKLSYKLLLLALSIQFSLFAQQPIDDSLNMSSGYSADVYYSLYNGTVKTEINSNWQLSFGIGTFNVAARANTASGSNREGSVEVYEMPGQDTNKWNSFDTSGYKSWKLLDNSDTTWDLGCFNHGAGTGGQFDYGWGKYNSGTHIVTGYRLYLLKITHNAKPLYKKLWIHDKTFGSWNFRIANLDGSSAYKQELKSSDFPDKNFVYYDAINNVVRDREPKKKDWDFVLTRYKSYQPGPGFYYPSTGILSNIGVRAAKADKVDINKAKLADHIGDTTSNLSAIGYDWKSLGQGFKWVIEDSLLYFVEDKYGRFWKLEFTGFGGSSTGKAYLTKTQLTWATRIEKAHSSAELSVYPNPAGNYIQIATDLIGGKASITNLEGQVLLQKDLTSSNKILIGALPGGMYFLTVHSDKGTVTRRFVKN